MSTNDNFTKNIGLQLLHYEVSTFYNTFAVAAFLYFHLCIIMEGISW